MVVENGGSAIIKHAAGSKVATLMHCKTSAVSCALESVTFSDLGLAMRAESLSSITKSDLRDLSGGGVTVAAGGDLTITDSYIWTSAGDLVVTSGGSLTIDYSEIGGALQSYEHCDLHIGAASSVTITNTNIVSAVYGIMLGNTDGAVIQYNNFVENTPLQDVDPIGPNTNADLRYNYWDNGAPDLGADYDTSMPAAQPYAEAGPRM